MIISHMFSKTPLLVIHLRIEFTSLPLTYIVVNGATPVYMFELLVPYVPAIDHVEFIRKGLK